MINLLKEQQNSIKHNSMVFALIVKHLSNFRYRILSKDAENNEPMIIKNVLLFNTYYFYYFLFILFTLWSKSYACKMA